jgi:hypothetical protein
VTLNLVDLESFEALAAFFVVGLAETYSFAAFVVASLVEQFAGY